MRFKITISLFVFCNGFMFSQYEIDEAAYSFAVKYNSWSYEKLRGSEIDSAIFMASQFIMIENGLSDKETVAAIYSIRANLQFEMIKRLNPEYKGGNTETIKAIESDLEAAVKLCEPCECDLLNDLHSVCLYTGNKEKYQEVKIRKLKIGDEQEDDPFYLGVGLNYMAPKNIVGVELCLGIANKLKQFKRVDPFTGKKYYPCGYNYPLSMGFLSLGVERSLDDNIYRAAKFDPIWLDALVSIHPFQFTYAQANTIHSINWRPEIGLAFYTLSVNYSFTYAFNKQFTYTPKHAISVNVVIPTVKWFTD